MSGHSFLKKFFEDQNDDISLKIEEKINSVLSEMFDGISCEVQVLEDSSIEVTFFDEDEEYVVILDAEDGTPSATIIGDTDDENDELEYDDEAIDLSDFNIKTIKDDDEIIIDTSDLSFITPEFIESILIEDETDEAFTNVIRGGKKVRKQLVRRKRKKILSSKRKMAIKRAVRNRRRTAQQAKRKRRKSMMLRKRMKIKRIKKGSRFKVAGSGSHL